jgi:hypothetical protein
VSMSDEPKERNILKLILIMRFACATLDVGHPLPMNECTSRIYLVELTIDSCEQFIDAVVVPTNVAAILRPRGGISQMLLFTLFGIHSTKYEVLRVWMLSMCSSTSLHAILPRKCVDTVRYAAAAQLSKQSGTPEPKVFHRGTAYIPHQTKGY